MTRPCNLGCQPDWHKDDCDVYLPELPHPLATCKHGRPANVRCSVCAGDALPSLCLSTHKGLPCLNELGRDHTDDHFNGDLRWGSHTTKVDVARFTTSDLREAFFAGFLASGDCGYDGAAYRAQDDSESGPNETTLTADFDDWLANR